MTIQEAWKRTVVNVKPNSLRRGICAAFHHTGVESCRSDDRKRRTYQLVVLADRTGNYVREYVPCRANCSPIRSKAKVPSDSKIAGAGEIEHVRVVSPQPLHPIIRWRAPRVLQHCSPVINVADELGTARFCGVFGEQALDNAEPLLATNSTVTRPPVERTHETPRHAKLYSRFRAERAQRSHLRVGGVPHPT